MTNAAAVGYMIRAAKQTELEDKVIKNTRSFNVGRNGLPHRAGSGEKHTTVID